MIRKGKSTIKTCLSIILISCFLVSCGTREKLQADKEVGAGDGLNTKSQEVLINDNVDLVNVPEEKELTPLPSSIEGMGDANKATLMNSEVPIRDGEELEIIQAQYQQDKEASNQGSMFEYPEYLVEINIPNLYEKMQMRAYQAYSVSDSPAGIYLIYNKIALSVLDSFEETCIADIDQNGEYELLSLFGFGSGIYRINLNVYHATNPIYFSSTTKVPMLQYHNCYVPKAGYGQLVFDQVSDSEVHLREMNVETQQVGEDYGKLVIPKESGLITLENLELFPYDTWDNVYNQDNWPRSNYDYESLTDIPELIVSVGDTIVSNLSSKGDWNGEKEESIEFSDAMTEDVPQFSAPSDLYKYDQEIKLEFQGVSPSSIKVMDTLITNEGRQIYSDRENFERLVRKGEEGAYYLGLENHFALHLSSNTASYTNPSYRGFRVICEFGENRTCEYVFTLSLGPIWKENKK